MVEQRRVGRDLALQHAEEVDLAGERVCDRLEDECGGRRPFDLERSAALGRRGDALDQEVEERVRAEVLRGDRAADREDLTARDTELEGRCNLVRVELLALEVALHQRLVDLDDLVEELLPVLLRLRLHRLRDRHRVAFLLPFRVQIGAHVEDVHDPLELVLGADRDVHGDAAGGELLLDLPERPEEVGALPVEHVHDQDAREAELLGELLHPRGADLEAHDARDDDQRALHDAERTARLALEGRVAGAVEQIHLPPLPLGVGERERDRELAVLLVLIGVGDRGAGVDRAEPVDLAGLEEERLEESRLARSPMTDDGDVADLAGLGCCHLCALLLVVELLP